MGMVNGRAMLGTKRCHNSMRNEAIETATVIGPATTSAPPLTNSTATVTLMAATATTKKNVF